MQAFTTRGGRWKSVNGFGRATRGDAKRGALKRRHTSLRPAIDALEVRCLLSTLVVTNFTDTPQAGLTDLRQAIAMAQSGDTITFTPTATPQTIALTSTLGSLVIPQANLTITGPGANLLTIDGQHACTVFRTDDSTNTSLSGLTVADGNGSYGGGISNYGTMTVNKCVLSNNYASVAGGGIYNYESLTLNNCTLVGNSAGSFGGGICNDGGQGSLMMSDCTIEGNSSGDFGGGLFSGYNTVPNGDTASITNCTFATNTAVTGGGVYNNGTATLINSIVSYGLTGDSSYSTAQASSLFGTDVVNAGALSGSNNLISDGSGGAGLTSPVNGDPLLAPLGSYGSTTQTMALFSGSAAIGAGIAVNGVTSDQRGLPLDSPNPDIGAFQTQPSRSASAPTVAIAAPPIAVAQEELIFTFTATDKVSSGTFAYAVNWNDGSNVEIVQGSSPVMVAHDYSAAGSYPLTVTALDLRGVSSAQTTVATPYVVAALTGANATQVVEAQSDTTLAVTTPPQLTTAVNAVNGVTDPQRWSVVVNVATGSYSGEDVDLDPGTVYFQGTAPTGGYTSPTPQNGTHNTAIFGVAPALEVDQGTVTWSGSQFSTSTDSPTILLTGGTLTLANDLILGTSDGSRPVIEVEGGTLILTGNILGARGAAAFVTVTGNGQVIDEGGNTYDRIAANGSYQPTGPLSVTQVASSAPTSVYGQPVTFTATVTAPNAAAGVPTGTVEFFDGSTDLGPGSALKGSGSTATSTFSIATLTLGTHSIQAVYTPSGGFQGSSGSLTQLVQSIAIEPDPTNPVLTDLFVGSNGAASSDHVQVNPIGSSNNGSTGVNVQTQLNGINTQTNFSQVFSSLHIYLLGGNENVQLANTSTINAFVTAGNGNDNIQLANGNNTVILGNGNDQVSAGNGNNTVVVGFGNDNVQLGNGNNVITLGSGTGNDNVQTGNGTNTVIGASSNGNDNVHFGTGNGDNVTLGAGNDNIQLANGGNSSNDRVVLGAGNDSVQIGNGGTSSNFNTVFVPSLPDPQAHIQFGIGSNNTIKAGNGGSSGGVPA